MEFLQSQPINQLEFLAVSELLLRTGIERTDAVSQALRRPKGSEPSLMSRVWPSIRGRPTRRIRIWRISRIPMAIFAPIIVPTPYDFEIAQDKRGLWRARDKGELIGGLFLTQQDAVRFALFEANGDLAHVHVVPAATAAAHSRSASRRRSVTQESDEDSGSRHPMLAGTTPLKAPRRRVRQALTFSPQLLPSSARTKPRNRRATPLSN